MESLKKSLHQSFQRTRNGRDSGKMQATHANIKLQEATAGGGGLPRDVEIRLVRCHMDPAWLTTPSGLVCCLYFADTFFREVAHHGPTMWHFLSIHCLPTIWRRGRQEAAGVVGVVHTRQGDIAPAPRACRWSPSRYCKCASTCCPKSEFSWDLAQVPDKQGNDAVFLASD